jgi:hypothetical protein
MYLHGKKVPTQVLHLEQHGIGEVLQPGQIPTDGGRCKKEKLAFLCFFKLIVELRWSFLYYFLTTFSNERSRHSYRNFTRTTRIFPYNNGSLGDTPLEKSKVNEY